MFVGVLVLADFDQAGAPVQEPINAVGRTDKLHTTVKRFRS